MAPTLRSNTTSAHSSPSAQQRGDTLSANNSVTPSTTPRKVPQCSKCKRPRAGHPRSGCPFVDSPSASVVDKENGLKEKRGNGLERQLSFALQNMALASPSHPMEREEDKAFVRNRRRKSAQPLVPSESLHSLDTNSNELVERLMKPGVLDKALNDNVSGGSSRIIRWQETIAKANATSTNRAMKPGTPGRSIMPGTLIPPTPDTSFATTNSNLVIIPKEERISASMTEIFDDNNFASQEGASYLPSSQSTRRPQPLGRSMSAVERDMFVAKLSEEASATIYIIPKEDVEDIAAKALSLKYIVRISVNDDEEDSQALMILGRDPMGVDALLQRVEDENVKARQGKNSRKRTVPVPNSNGRSSLAKVAAGAAVVGAVGTWAGLAFT